ncbi:MAG: hypothetical protein ACQEQO_06365 [Thermodesulfobacteriota bacterium]
MDFKRADEVYEEAIGVYRGNYTETFEKPGYFHHPQKDDGQLHATIEIGKVASWSVTFKYFFGVPCRRSEATCPAESGI